MEIKKIHFNEIKPIYSEKKTYSSQSESAATMARAPYSRAGQRRLREETRPVRLEIGAEEKETTVKKVTLFKDNGWDDELYISLENGIFLECKWYQDPGFFEGDRVKLLFNEDRSRLTVHLGEHSLKFFNMGKYYRAI